MTQILVEKAVIEQALEALEEAYAAQFETTWFEIKPEHFTALREALGYCIDEGCPHHGTTHECTNPLAEQAEQEPVAWMNTNGAVNKLRETGWAMNAAPVRTKDLTDEEIHKCDRATVTRQDFARAVIAADRKKNNV